MYTSPAHAPDPYHLPAFTMKIAIAALLLLSLLLNVEAAAWNKLKSGKVMKAVKSLLKTNAACDPVDQDRNYCVDDAFSFYSKFEYPDENGVTWRVLVASGAPDHEAEAEYNQTMPNPNRR